MRKSEFNPKNEADLPVLTTVSPLADMTPAEVWKARLAQAALALA